MGSRHSDVNLELKPLDLGHMLMLEYDLVLPSTSKLPSLVDMYSEKKKLRERLAVWSVAVGRERTREGKIFPTLLTHICDSTYNTQSLSLELLQGNDRFRAAYLKEVCATLPIGLYIADLDRTLTGFCEDFHDDDDYYMSVEDEDSIVLTRIVDLQGNSVGSNLELDIEDNFVASEPFDDGPDKEDIDRKHALVTYYYRRTVSIGT